MIIRNSTMVCVVWMTATLVAGELSAQCEGSAVAGTTYTQHFNCSNPNNALQWSLSVSCLDECGNVWWTLAPRQGSADGACDFVVRDFCSPEWYRYNYTNGMYAESSAFSAYLFAGCRLRADPVITAGDCPCAPPCQEEEPPIEPPGPITPCSAPVSVESTYLDLVGSTGPGLDSFAGSLFTGRIEEVDGFSYIMDDWALVGTNAQEASQVLSAGSDGASSALPAPLTLQDLSDLRRGGAGEPASLALLIASPAHPHNGRHIPSPAVGLRPGRVTVGSEPATAAVRIDVGESRNIRGVQLLYAVGRLADELDLEGELRSRLQLRFASRQQHRVIVYAVVDVDSEGRIRLRGSRVVLPLCCCNPACK